MSGDTQQDFSDEGWRANLSRSRQLMPELVRNSYLLAGLGVLLCFVCEFLYFYCRKHFYFFNSVLEAFVSVLPNLIAVLLIYWVSQLLFKTRSDYHRGETIRNLMAAMQIHEGILTSKITAVYEDMKESDVTSLITTALENRQNIQILATMMAGTIITQDMLSLAGKQDCKITIILLHPDSEAATQRSRELKMRKTNAGKPLDEVDEDYAKNTINTTVQSLRSGENKQVNEKILEILYLDSIPGLYLCICGNQALVGFFSHSQHATEGPMLKIADIPNKCDDTAKTMPQLVRKEFDKAEKDARERKDQ